MKFVVLEMHHTPKVCSMSIKLLTCDGLDLSLPVLYTYRCSFSRIFEAIEGLVQGLDGLFLCGGQTECLMR